MIKRYELWLDESGQFKQETELKKKNLKPSFVGGVLIEKSMLGRILFDEMIDGNRNHAMNVTDSDKREYILPVLERLKNEYNARQVFFENADYEDGKSNRQLYLRIIAEGLLQLLQTLNAQNQSIVLDVIIAQRQDVDSPDGQRRILDQEYIRALQLCIEKKKKEHKMLLDENCALHFEIQPAHREKKLQMADFACNTRLTRDSKAFRNVKERVMALYENAYIFTLSEISSENFIKRSLAQGHLADAVMELYGSKDELDRGKMLNFMLERIRHMDYRLIKNQLKECVSELTSYVAQQDDFKVGEIFLEEINDEFLVMLEANGYACQNLKFSLLLQLSDMYLRQGNIVSARRILEACEETQKKLGNSLEEVFSYYQLKEKEALLAINEFDYGRADSILNMICATFENLMQAVCDDKNLKIRFPNLRSEYYGDALCMKIYAMMFMQRENSELYEEMCRLSDIALQNYPEQEGELERHRQYRSHIELEQGNYKEALKWLLLAQGWKDMELTSQNLVKFLKQICTVENETSCQYYLMYYLLVLAESKYARDDIAETMWKALNNQKELMRIGGLRKAPQHSEDAIEVDINDVQQEKSGVKFHPMEVIHWKYASYLYHSGKYQMAYEYYGSAEEMCFVNSNCHTMWIVGLGIMAEKICCMIKGKAKGIDQELQLLKERIHTITEAPLTDATKRFIDTLRQGIEGALSENSRIDIEQLWKVSRKITY